MTSPITGLSAAAIEKLAEEHGIDPHDLPAPPTDGVLHFLHDLDPQIRSRIASAQSAVKISEDVNEDPDALDASPFEDVRLAQDREDRASRRVVGLLAALKARVDELLDALYRQPVPGLTAERLARAYHIDWDPKPDHDPDREDDKRP